MKALTIWQPWASLIMAGAKPYEFRGWRPPASAIGQRIVVHASALKRNLRDLILLEAILQAGGERSAETCLRSEIALPLLAAAIEDPSTLPIGVGLGTAILGEPRSGIDIAAEFGVPRANDSDRDQHANWGWPLTDIEPFAEPIPMRGLQGLWPWPEPTEWVK
jgi:hypothetical protein